MFNGKNKAVTFSFDDGVTQDRRLVEIFNKYSLKATFNINSGRLGESAEINVGATRTTHNKIMPDELKALYDGHEIAVHTLTHPNLCRLTDDEIIKETEQDRLELCALSEQNVVGMAYPGGNFDDRVVKLLCEETGVKYSRTVIPTYSFELQTELYTFNPTIHAREYDRLFELADDFIELNPSSPKLFYIWGHAYEFDAEDGWNKFESFCKKISGHSDIFYGTNRECLFV